MDTSTSKPDRLRQICFRAPPEVRRALKIAAASDDLTLEQYLHAIVIQALQKRGISMETDYDHNN